MQSSRFVASFPNMERIYQSLRVAAGEGREVQVNDTTFAPPPGADSGIWLMDPKLIRRYVIVRENERKKSSVPGDSGVAVFDLLGEWQLANDERDVAYAKSGIVLVPAPVH